MVRYLRLLIRDTPILRKTIYGPIFWFMNNVLRYESWLLQKHGPEALKRVNEISRRFDIDVYPTFGTLLGLIRDGELMKHDRDMDFAILPTSTNLNPFFGEIQKQGFIFEWMETVDDCLTEVRFRYRELPIDFFLHSYTADGERLMMIQTDSTTRRYEYPLVKTLIDHEVLGLNLRIPENVGEYLASMYGSWKKAVKSGWNSTMAPSFVGVDDARRYVVATSRSINDFVGWLETHPRSDRLRDKGYSDL